ncbi:hypothetical protein [Arcobacter porcinus]|uniref:hypothetical protein n=1 Tax=Arcobacter porcinus TaxID=1935204 RepID=UPI0008290A32|nr:hypothetical protein [Arcobacter porcinus]OCL89408.1 hypothetical protein AAX27_01939 [Aliarcobacter thereius]
MEKKAKLVNLDKEYESNYEMTSSLLHFTSYSLLTPNFAKGDEVKYNIMIINQYIMQIIKNISTFLNLDFFDMVTIVKVE